MRGRPILDVVHAQQEGELPVARIETGMVVGLLVIVIIIIIVII